jgi:hypothetical protein
MTGAKPKQSDQLADIFTGESRLKANGRVDFCEEIAKASS